MSSSVWIKTILFSIFPVLESKFGIPYGIANGLSPWIVLILALIGNIAIIPAIFFFLDYLHMHFMKIRHYERLFNLYAGWLMNRFNKRKEKLWPYVVFFMFVALPLPGTGAYTGCLLAWLLKMNRLKAYGSVILGVIVDGLLVMLGTIGIIKIV